MEKAYILGRLGRDPEIRVSQSGTKVAKFSVAVNRKFKRENEPDTDWFYCVAFDKKADFVDKYLRQGVRVAISGDLQNDNYTNKDGQKVYSVQIIVEEIEFAESKGDNADKPRAERPALNGDGWMNIGEAIDEELPFL